MKEIVMNGWVSIIPDKMYNAFIDKKYIVKGTTEICDTNLEPYIIEIYTKDQEAVTVKSKSEGRRLKELGFTKAKTIYYAKIADYDKMHRAIGKWYTIVFDYVENWLKKNNFIKLKKGSLKTGFCVEQDENAETVKNWNAPLAEEKNKVDQIKEKFGRITVYFGGLTKEEREKIKKFEKSVQKKFDCETTFC